MQAYDVIRKMDLQLRSSLYFSELAMAAQSSMMNSEELWDKGPSLHTAANRRKLDRKLLPFCLKSSDLFNVSISILNSLEKEGDGKNGKSKIFNINELTPASEIMSAQSILFIFCLLEEYEAYCYEKEIRKDICRIIGGDNYSLKNILDKGINGVIEDSIKKEMSKYKFQSCKKRIKSWGKLGCRCLSDRDIELYEEISRRRNQLTHDPSPNPASRLESVSFFLVARKLVKEISETFGDETINKINTNWSAWDNVKFQFDDNGVEDINEALKK